MQSRSKINRILFSKAEYKQKACQVMFLVPCLHDYSQKYITAANLEMTQLVAAWKLTDAKVYTCNIFVPVIAGKSMYLLVQVKCMFI